jgi:hypothetical protein
MGYRWFEETTGSAILDRDRTFLPGPVGPGASLELDGRVHTPWEPGRYELRVAPVQEFVAWFDDLDEDNGARLQVEVALPADLRDAVAD